VNVTLTPIAGFALAFALALVITPLARRLAIRFGAVDKRVLTKVHAHDVPRLGGVAIAVGFYVPVLALALRWNAFQMALYQDPRRVAALLGGGLVIFALGVYDDLRGASAWKKLAVQVPVAALAWWAGVRIGGTAGPSGAYLSFAPLLSFGTTVLWLVAVMNAINLIDGLDGLASGIALLALAAAAVCAWHRGEPALALITIVLAGSIGGFLIHNFHPASVFMGDSGSMLIGYIIGVSAVWSSQKAATLVGLVLPAVALGLPLLDTSLAVWRRLATGRPVFDGDLDHIHHRLLARGWSQRRAVLTLYAIALLYSGLSVALVYANDRRLEWPLLVAAAALAIALSRWLGYAGSQLGAESEPERYRRLRLLQELHRLERRLAAAPDEHELAAAVEEFESEAARLVEGSAARHHEVSEVAARTIARARRRRSQRPPARNKDA
jgi:UDP-GlcNAc:undecaprenyl-phosphate GlcNAc-1-phosphate transferase